MQSPLSEIRLATEQDAEVLAELRYEFREGLERTRESRDAFLARARDWMARRLGASSSDWRCWVAVRDEAVVGHLWLQRVEKIPNPVAEPEAHGYVTNLYVRPACRGQGTGSALLRVALQWCAESGFDSVFLWPTAESRTLYARHGFTASEDLMQLRRRG